jgi:putative transposase
VYGYRKVSDDLRELGEQCGINRVHRLMRSAGIRSQTGYAKRKYKRGGAPSLVAPNHLAPVQRRRTESSLGNGYHVYPYLRRLALSGRGAGPVFAAGSWLVDEFIDREVAMNALLMAVWRRQPKNTVMVHSDQGSQFSSYDWRDF